MKLILTALTLALGMAGAGAASATELPLSQEALVELAKSGQPLCGSWRAHDQSCEDIGFIDVVAAGRIRQTYRFRLSLEPNLEVVMQETSSLEGNAFCSVFDFDNLDITVLLDGQPAPDEQAQTIAMILQESVSDYQGKKTCETFSRDSETGELSSVVTIDGEQAPELAGHYRLIPPGDRVHLRAPDEGPELARQEV